MRLPKNKQILVQRVKKIFSQFEKGNYTFSFESFILKYPTSPLLHSLREYNGEKLVIFYCNSSCWTLLTDNQLIWCKQDLISTLSYDEVADADIIPYELLNKSSITKLYIACLNGDIYRVPIETGGPLYAFMKILGTIPTFFKHDLDKIEQCRLLLKKRIADDKKKHVIVTDNN